MILTKADNKTPVYIREIDSAWPKGQATVVISKVGERFIVSEGFSQVMAMMASGTGAEPHHTQSQRNSGGGVVGMKITVFDNHVVNIDPNTAPSLVTYLTNNSECFVLIEYWFQCYYNHFGTYPSIIADKNVGVICGCVKDGYTEEAMDILEWQWTSEHYRAVYLRNKGMLDPATVLSASRRVNNYAMAQQAKLEAMQQQSTTTEVRFCPDTGALLQ